MDTTFQLSKKDTDQQKPSHLFLLRVWPDENGDGQEKWEGKIQYVLTGETEVFSDWASLNALLQSMLAEENDSKAKAQKAPAVEPRGSHWHGRES